MGIIWTKNQFFRELCPAPSTGDGQPQVRSRLNLLGYPALLCASSSHCVDAPISSKNLPFFMVVLCSGTGNHRKFHTQV